MGNCCGCWSVQTPVSEENKKVLETALADFVGSDFEPLAVGTKVVNGIDYIFVAKSTPVVLNPKSGLVKIYVTATPAGEAPRLVNIETII